MSVASSSSSLDEESSSSVHGSDEVLSILQPLGYQASVCGYCATEKGRPSATKTGRSYGCWAHTLSCKTYRDLIDQGWRRSGKYLYKPDMRATCCPQYTISLDAAAFTPSKSQRQLLHRFSTFLISGGRERTPGWGTLAPPTSSAPALPPKTGGPAAAPPPPPPPLASTSSRLPPDSLLTTAVSVTFNPAPQPPLDDDADSGFPSHRPAAPPPPLPPPRRANGTSVPSPVAPPNKEIKGKKGKGKAGMVVPDFLEMVHEGDWANAPPDHPFAHRFEYVLEEASYTDEKYDLFRQYQIKIHGEPEEKVTPKGFRRFLVDTPLEIEPTGHPQHRYGSHHAKYLLDGKLIALAVLDILPTCVSSVYFVWSPAYAAMGLGKLSALREAAMVREMHRDGLETMERYMMGFYIHTCAKMRYKAEYQPSSLLDPETNVYYPWEVCRPLLAANPHASFSRPSAAVALPPSPPSEVAPPSPMDAATDDEADDDDDVPWPAVPPPGFLDPTALPKSLLVETAVVESRTLVPLLFSSGWHDHDKAVEMSRCLAALGDRTQGRIALWLP